MTVYDLNLMTYIYQRVIIKNFDEGIIYDGYIECIPIDLESRKISCFAAIEDKLIIDIYEED